MTKILAIIPARAGSKSIKDKNIRLINGKPLLVYSIEHALASSLVGRVIVSTDSKKYAAIAKQHGAEVPFLRPIEISGDLATDLEVFQHALVFLSKAKPAYQPEFCVHLRPTYPLRPYGIIDEMIRLLYKNREADSIRSVVKTEQTPFKMWFINPSEILSPVIDNPSMAEAWNMPRQALPEVFIQNACVDVIRTTTILEKNSMSGRIILGYKMETMYDIDYMQDLKLVKKIMRNVK